MPTITPPPLVTVAPRIPWIKADVCVPLLPIRMVLDSPATPSAAMSMLLLPVVRLEPAEDPKAMLLLPVVFLLSAFGFCFHTNDSLSVVVWFHCREQAEMS